MSDEVLKAIRARLSNAMLLIQSGKNELAWKYLHNLALTIPAPEDRHCEAAQAELNELRRKESARD